MYVAGPDAMQIAISRSRKELPGGISGFGGSRAALQHISRKRSVRCLDFDCEDPASLGGGTGRSSRLNPGDGALTDSGTPSGSHAPGIIGAGHLRGCTDEIVTGNERSRTALHTYPRGQAR